MAEAAPPPVDSLANDRGAMYAQVGQIIDSTPLGFRDTLRGDGSVYVATPPYSPDKRHNLHRDDWDLSDNEIDLLSSTFQVARPRRRFHVLPTRDDGLRLVVNGDVANSYPFSANAPTIEGPEGEATDILNAHVRLIVETTAHAAKRARIKRNVIGGTVGAGAVALLGRDAVDVAFLVDDEIQAVVDEWEGEDPADAARAEFEAAHPGYTLSVPLIGYGTPENGGAVVSEPGLFDELGIPPADDPEGFANVREVEVDFDDDSCAEVTQLAVEREGVRIITEEDEGVLAQTVNFEGLVQVCLTEPDNEDAPSDATLAVQVGPLDEAEVAGAGTR